jgi:hypothetical protein
MMMAIRPMMENMGANVFMAILHVVVQGLEYALRLYISLRI